jgi:predicted PurR-regulated permease PerM
MYFALSLIMLLSVIETAYVVAAPLLLALLVYELLYNYKGRESRGHEEYKKKIGILIVGMVLTGLAFIMYHLVSAYISNSYATASNYAIPPITRLYINFIGNQLAQLKTANKSVAYSYNATVANLLGSIGTPSLFLGFGGASSLSLP